MAHIAPQSTSVGHYGASPTVAGIGRICVSVSTRFLDTARRALKTAGMNFPAVILRLPDWVEPFLEEETRVYADAEDRMRLAVRLSELNVKYGTGGPFGAAVFDMDSGRLISVGVNLVTASKTSIAHAEIVALATAQQLLDGFDLGAQGMPRCELVSSTEPCAMCQGAVPWAGVRRLVCGARDEEAAAIGMDEGAKLPDWPDALAQRGIEVVRDVCRTEAAAVLRAYVESGGVIYNGRSGVP